MKIKQLLLGCIIVNLCGCEVLAELRRVFHPEAEGLELGNAGLKINVEPSVPMQILIDHIEVSRTATYHGRTLKAGAHNLEVYCPGYYDVVLPLSLIDFETLTLPIALRALQEEPDAPVERPVTPQTPRHEPRSKPSKLPEPELPSPPLPEGVRSIVLQVVSTPEQSLVVDQIPVANKQIELVRIYGKIAIGELVLSYRVGGADTLQLGLPNDSAIWFHDNQQVATGSSIPIHSGVISLKRVFEDTEITIVLRRLEE